MTEMTSFRLTERRSGAGSVLHAAVVDENRARAAAGLTMAFGAVAFVYASFDKLFWPIQTVATLFLVDFLIRVTAGLERSPTGLVAGWMTRRQAPQWVSAKPKRFAWTLGLAMALAMTIITNDGIRGALPRTICLICLTLMWMEAVLGLCLGCEIYRVAVRRGWRTKDDAFEVCPNGACDLDAAAPRERTDWVPTKQHQLDATCAEPHVPDRRPDQAGDASTTALTAWSTARSISASTAASSILSPPRSRT